MATSQKRSGGSRASSGGRRTSSASKGKSSSSRSRKQPPAPAHRPYRREVGAGICLLLAIFTLFGCFHIQALFIDALCGLIRGLIGYGFWLTPPPCCSPASSWPFTGGGRCVCGCSAP